MTIFTLVMMNIFNQIFNHKLPWFPNNLSAHIQEMTVFNTVSKDLIGTSVILGILIIGLFIATIFIFNKREKAM